MEVDARATESSCGNDFFSGCYMSYPCFDPAIEDEGRVLIDIDEEIAAAQEGGHVVTEDSCVDAGCLEALCMTSCIAASCVGLGTLGALSLGASGVQASCVGAACLGALCLGTSCEEDSCAESPCFPSISIYSIPSCLESIVDKKVNQVALNFFEMVADWLLSCLSSSYNTFFEIKTILHEIGRPNHPITEETFKVHYFVDGTPLYDITPGLHAKIDTKSVYNPTTQESSNFEYIAIDNKKVLFTTSSKVTLQFKKLTTKYLVVDDKLSNSGEQADRFRSSRITSCRIIEQPLRNEKNEWTVDTTQVYKTQKSCLQYGLNIFENVYLVDSPREFSEQDPRSDSGFLTKVKDEF
jgi:hypothetical protein